MMRRRFQGVAPRFRCRIFSYITFTLAVLTGVRLNAQPAQIDADLLSRGPSLKGLWKSYQRVSLPPVRLDNGPQLKDRLLNSVHAGALQISLVDFLQIVIENGLDLEADRYLYLIAQTDLLRTRSGQAARGLPGAPIPGGLFAGAIGIGLGNSANVSAGGTGAAAISGSGRQVVIGPRGSFDPTLSLNFSFDRVANPLNTTRVAGTTMVTVPSTVLQTRFQQELPFGAGYSISFNLQRQATTQRFLLFNPAFTSFFSAQFYQPILNGFGLALNRRFITFAENNRKISREIFSQNLNNSLANAANLYWDFVALQKQVEVATEALIVSEKLRDDNQRGFELGSLARLDIVQAEAQIAANRRDLVATQTNLMMQELKLKSVMSKILTTDLESVHLVASDPLPDPNGPSTPSVDEAVKDAMQRRSSIRQAQLGIENQQIAQAYTRNNLLPTLSVFAQFNSYALAGGTDVMFRQMAQWEYPEYSVGFSLTFSVRNRAGQADDVRARLELQQAEASLHQVRRQVESGVQAAVIGLRQYRTEVEAAQRVTEISERTFRGEEVRFVNGISTPYRVILAHRDLIAARSALVQAQVNYAKAWIAEELATGTLLEQNRITFTSAFEGDLWKTSRKF